MSCESIHINRIANGQQLTSQADRLFVFYFFPTALFLKTKLAGKQTAHLQAAQADPQIQAWKRSIFLHTNRKILLKLADYLKIINE